MMTEPLLVIVSGLPCSGKTTLSLRLAADFHLPFMNKDGIKERLFDSLGWSDRSRSKELGLASYDLLYDFVTAQLKAGRSSIVESNFKASVDAPRFLAVKQEHPYLPFQIVCQAEGTVLLERFKRRSESGNRHPGHVDHLNYAEFKQVFLAGEYEPMPIGGELLLVDTTDFESIDYAGVAAAVASALARIAAFA